MGVESIDLFDGLAPFFILGYDFLATKSHLQLPCDPVCELLVLKNHLSESVLLA
jgi:hypothetical protein